MHADAELLKKRLQDFLGQKEYTARTAIGWLYTCLNTLDSKASTLLRVNGIFLALVSGSILFTLREPAFKPGGNHLSCIGITVLLFNGIAFVLLLLSSLLCHIVARIEWPFLGKAPVSSDECDLSIEEQALFEVVRKRTSRFQWAWRLSPWAILFAALSLVIIVITLLK